jgi:polyisoprenoid-binding protein YceI
MKQRFVILSLLLAGALLFSSLTESDQTGEANNPPAPPLNKVTPGQSSLRYRLDPSQSRFIVQVFRGGLLKAFGHDHNIQIRDFSGEALITPDVFNPASMQMTIKADSLAVLDKVSDDDRREIETTMRNQVLETSKYPTITFKSTQAAAEKNSDGSWAAKIWGDISLHGATGTGYIISRVTFSGNSLRATGNFSLKQTDYKIKPVSVAGGTVKVKDEIKFRFDIVAVRQ